MELHETRAQTLGASSFEQDAERNARLSLLHQGILEQPCALMLPYEPVGTCPRSRAPTRRSQAGSASALRD